MYAIRFFSGYLCNVASITADVSMLREDSSGYFSHTAFNYVTTIDSNIIYYADIVKIYNKLYLISYMNPEFSYSAYLEGVYLDYNTGKTVVFEINPKNDSIEPLLKGEFKGGFNDIHFKTVVSYKWMLIALILCVMFYIMNKISNHQKYKSTK